MPLGAQHEAPLPEPQFSEFAGDVSPFEDRQPSQQFCVFRAGRERFCITVLDVEEVVDWPLVTRVPLSPPFLMGIFNLRGSIVPLVDIAFTEGRRPGMNPKHVVVAALRAEGDRDHLRLGIAADEVIGTYGVTDNELLDQAPVDVPHCYGLLRHDDRLALALDMRRLIKVFPVPVL
jgi:chemotaxis signal transduction protein